MDRNMQHRLQGFEAVWKRVSAAKSSGSPGQMVGGVKLMPKKHCKCKNTRYMPGR